jgi:3-methyladenine DNA glycosylase AlkD
MTAAEIVEEIRPLGRDAYKKIMFNHGAKEPIFGVKVEELKKIQKRIKKDYQLALDLYDTGIYDAMYLAGLIADDARMTKKDLQHWLDKATSPALGQYTIPWVAAGSPHGREMALKWIESKDEKTAMAGWATLSSIVAITDDDDLDIPQLKKLLDRAGKSIHKAPNRARCAMNGFVIAVGSYVAPLTEHALQVAEHIGKVTVDMGDTACQVPSAADYIEKVRRRGSIGKKRKTAKC